MARAAAPAVRSGINDSIMLVLPPVSWLSYFASVPACSTRMLAQSASSSSATSMARAVLMPWPISDFAAQTVMVSSGSIRSQTPGSSGARGSDAARSGVGVGGTALGCGGASVGAAVGAATGADGAASNEQPTSRLACGDAGGQREELATIDSSFHVTLLRRRA